MPRTDKEFAIFTAKAATGQGAVLDVRDFDYVVCAVATASSANLTIKFAGAVTDTAPDFTASQTAANMFDYLQLTDMENISTNLPAMVRGDTGLAPAGTDDFRLFRFDVRGLKWFTAVVTARSAGSVSVNARAISC